MIPVINHSIGTDTTFFRALVESKTVVIYDYFCGITDRFLVANFPLISADDVSLCLMKSKGEFLTKRLCKHAQVWEWQKKPLLIINRHFCLCVAEKKPSSLLQPYCFSSLKLLANTNVAGMLKTGFYLNNVRFYNCNICTFSNGNDTCNYSYYWYCHNFFWAIVRSKTVVLYNYICGLTD